MWTRRRAVEGADVPPSTAAEPAPRGRWARRRGGGYGPTAGDRAAGAVAGGGLLLVRLVWLLATIVIVIIALAIVFVVLDASTSNSIVSQIREWAHTLAAPFRNIFSLHSVKGTFALNYGIAIVIYAIIAGLIARLISALVAPAERRAP